ncbi:MAG TPA: SDR family oxidoreductase [Bacteroidota bacterium]|nr:SDR family oxidoreductase [Bacteroidota bacterium]
MAHEEATRWTLRGKKALVTGGTRGIGAAVAAEMCALGAEVFVVARSAADIHARVDEWSARGWRAGGMACDVADARERETLIAHVAKRWGKLDILVNNAGTNIRKPTVGYTAEESDLILRTNLDSAFDLCRRSYALLKSAPGGSIVNVASVGGLTALGTGTPYAMSKAALLQMTRALAAEWGADGIRVNAVAPWYIRTPLAEPVLRRADYLGAVLARTPLRRVGEPEEIAAAVAFLAMDAASYITGACLPVDGGFLACGFTPPA